MQINPLNKNYRTRKRGNCDGRQTPRQSYPYPL